MSGMLGMSALQIEPGLGQLDLARQIMLWATQ
jgi:hypothetical protein